MAAWWRGSIEVHILKTSSKKKRVPLNGLLEWINFDFITVGFYNLRECQRLIVQAFTLNSPLLLLSKVLDIGSEMNPVVANKLRLK